MKISELTIFSNNLLEQGIFYRDSLGFALITETPDKITFKTGLCYLSFRKSGNSVQSHFAFTIPNGSIENAREYLINRNVELIESGTNFITDFPAWKAKSLYFYDADRNIVEFIERGDIPIRESSFYPKSIINISEIAIPTSDVKAVYNKINSIRPIEVYSGDFHRFCALGDPQGLFIVFDNTIKKWYPTDEIAQPADFIIRGDYNFQFKDGEII